MTWREPTVGAQGGRQEQRTRRAFDSLSRRVTQLPWGILGYAEVASNQTGISSLTDLTDLSVAVEVGASRRIKVTLAGLIRQNTSNGFVTFQIRESTTSRNSRNYLLTTLAQTGAHVQAVLTPSAGTHTYKGSMSTTANTCDLLASSGARAFILVEDIGPA